MTKEVLLEENIASGDETQTLNPFHMPMRAENITLPLLLQLKHAIKEPLNRQIISIHDFFCHRAYYRRFQMGLKGWGKTLAVLIALHKKVVEDAQFIPTLLTFSKHRGVIEIHNPLRLASRETWGSRLDSFGSFDEALNEANCVIFDDIHYIVEYLATKPSFFPKFLSLLERVVAKSHEQVKVLLVSEAPLFSYAEVFENNKFDDVLLKFGLVPRVQYGEEAYFDRYEELDQQLCFVGKSFELVLCGILTFAVGFGIEMMVMRKR